MLDRAALQGMTREQKIEWLKKVEERERRLKLRKDVYVPNDGQKKVHESDKKIRLVISGNGAGKTTLGVQEALWSADGYNPITDQFIPVPRRVAVVLDKPDKVEDKWLPEIRKWFHVDEKSLKKNGKPYYNQILRPNGSEVKFMFHEQDPLTFESLEVDDIIFDEPPPRHVYIALIRGMRNKGKKARILIIGTPITGAWLRKEIYDPWRAGELEDTECFKYSTRVNEVNLPEGYVDWYASKLSEKERAIRIEGNFFDLDGLALAHLFKNETHVIPRNKFKWDDDYPVVLAIDPHPSKKHVAALVGADRYGPVWIKEIAAKMTPRKFAQELKKFIEGYKVIDIVCDDLGSADMTGGEDFKSFIQILNEEGIMARPTRWEEKHDKKDEDWVARLQDALDIPDEPDNFGMKLPALRIVEGNIGIIDDIETVEWDKYRNMEMLKPTLNIVKKDYLSCLKYALATHLHVNKRKEKALYRNKGAYGIPPRHQTQARRQGKIVMGRASRKYGLHRGKL
jgi:hypothetical protein